ncbi:iron ABC transporter permease [Roseobacter sp.]|uniref:FecCD family ABC transporter permease n=1 Tax=Roseobacter sp. TaxID=1907202 RepID=UPI0032996F71
MPPNAPTSSNPGPDWRVIAVCLLGGLGVLAVWSMGVGAAALPMGDVLAVLINPDAESRTSIIVWTVRLPRVLAAISVGAALAVAGAIMQALTGNPLAEPGLLGVNAGAAFVVVILTVVLGQSVSSTMLIWGAFAGAACAACAVYGLGAAGQSGATPIKLVLAGVVIGTFLGVITATMLIVDAQTLDAVRHWTAGSLRGRSLSDVLTVLPYLCAGLIAAYVLRAQFTSLSLGRDVAQSLGQNPALWRMISGLIVVVLAGSAVAVAGPVGFVGLVVPHMTRMTCGPDYRRIIPVALLGGAVLTLLADSIPRAVWSNDVPVGISLALIGAPFFVWLARGRIRSL